MNQYEWDHINQFIEKLRILKEREGKLSHAYIVTRSSDVSEIVNETIINHKILDRLLFK